MLYHISEEPNIQRFQPRAMKEGGPPVVWAVHADRLRNYLLPRDCPRVTFFAGDETSPADRERFLGASAAVVAIESAWLQRVRTAQLFCYAMPAQTFSLTDACAGYYQSEVAVTPTGVEVIADPLAALIACNVELRMMPSLWRLHDQVIVSTLSYSIIRMRNAGPRGKKEEIVHEGHEGHE